MEHDYTDITKFNNHYDMTLRKKCYFYLIKIQSIKKIFNESNFI